MNISYDDYLRQKDEFIRMITSTMRKMGLKVLERGIDFIAHKPDIVAVYPDKMKYYVIEPISSACFEADSPRLTARDSMSNFRNYCKKLFPHNHSHGAVASCVISDLAMGTENFNFKSLGNLELNSMSKYACLAIPIDKVEETTYVLDYLKIAHQNLDILGKFNLVLISKKQSELLGETKKFVKFILDVKN